MLTTCIEQTAKIEDMVSPKVDENQRNVRRRIKTSISYTLDLLEKNTDTRSDSTHDYNSTVSTASINIPQNFLMPTTCKQATETNAQTSSLNICIYSLSALISRRWQNKKLTTRYRKERSPYNTKLEYVIKVSRNTSDMWIMNN